MLGFNKGQTRSDLKIGPMNDHRSGLGLSLSTQARPRPYKVQLDPTYFHPYTTAIIEKQMRETNELVVDWVS